MGACCSTSGFAETYEHARHVSSIDLIKELSETAEKCWKLLLEQEEGNTDRIDTRIVRETLTKRSPYVEPAHAQRAFARYAGETINFGQFCDLFVEYHVSTPMHAASIFQDACLKFPGVLTAADLGNFLADISGGAEHHSLHELESMIAYYEQNADQLIVAKAPKGCMSVEAFAQFLVDASRNSFADKTKLKKVYQDMHRPLSEYYIASSHNSSLLGNQLTSRSSSEAIKRALLLGVRMIELDAWEGEDGEPIVTHGHTLVVPTTFEACIAVVREVAFFKTKYPLILTIENHCGLEQQRRQAVILHEQLGSMLYGYDRDFATTPLHQLMEGEHAWKSPEELIGRIIIRDKPIKKLRRRDDRAGRRASAFLDMHRRRSAGILRSGTGQMDTLPSSMLAMARASIQAAAKSIMTAPSAENFASSSVGVDLDEDAMKAAADAAADADAGAGAGAADASSPSPSSSSHFPFHGKSAKAKEACSDDDDDEDDDDEEDPSGAYGSPLPTIIEDSLVTPLDIAPRRPSPDRLAAETSMVGVDDGETDSNADFMLPMSVVAVLTDRFDRRSVAKRVSARLVRKLRPLSVEIARSTSAAGSLHSSETGSSLASVKPGFDDDDDDDDSGEFEFDEETISTLERITEAIKARSADTALLALMYIKNVKLRYKISPFGVDFHEPGFCSSSSIDERKLATLTKYPERSLSLASYCCRHIIRVYPAGQRFDSSNFDPLPAWSAGVQCVALNVQKNSPAVWISHGKFRDNGGAGYVLKPPALRSEDASVEFSEPLTLKVDVLSGHYLMPAFDFRDASRDPLQIPTEVCVETSIHGVKADTINFRTRPVKRNCFNPSWNQAAQFKVTRPDLAHFLMVVKDQDGQVFYQASLALHCVREGYRVVPLSTPSLAPSKYAFLFCKFTILPMEDAQSSPEEI